MPSIWSKSFIQCMVINALVFLASQMLNTLIVPYALEIGNLASIAGFMAGLSYGASILVRPYSGVLSDYTDKGRWMQAACAIVLLSIIILLSAWNTGMILFARVVMGAGHAIATTVLMAIVADVLPPERVGTGMSVFGVSHTMAQMLGPAIGLELTSALGYRSAFILTGIFMSAALVISLFFRPFPAKRSDKLHRAILRPSNLIAREAVSPAITAGLYAILNGGILQFISVYAQEKQLAGAGIYYVLNSAGILLARIVFSRSTDRTPMARTTVISSTFCTAAMLMLGFGNTAPVMLGSALIYGFGYGYQVTVLQARCVAAPPPEKHGTGSSTYYIGIDLGFVIGNFCGGVLVQKFSVSIMYLVYILPAVLAAVLGLFWGRKSDKLVGIA